MTVFWPFVARITAKPLVQGFLGAVLAIVLMFGAWKVYGLVRWQVYGKNEQRISVLEANMNAVIQYLQRQEAAKGAK